MVNLRTHFGGLGNRLFQLAFIYAKARSGELPDIYLQDESYFRPYRDEIRAIFGQNVKPLDMVSIHVRRGDYLKGNFHVNLCDTDYYERAIEQFPEDTSFLVFCADRQQGSDDKGDLDWCRKRFRGTRFKFSQGENEIDDFNLMSGCKAHIIANSTFSWWAAFVSGKPTICPEKWFTDGVQRISLPDSWTKI